MKSCLEGVKIVEMSHYIAAPFCGQLLADMGAEIIKVERPGEGNADAGRENAPMYKGMSLYYAAYNRNKKTLTLDIGKEEGKRILRELVAQSDVLIENFRPGVLDKLGLGYKDLEKINSRLIMTSISGYGQNGPYRDRSALDMAIQAVSGFMSVTGFPEGPPTKGGPVVGDFVSALYGALATVAAYNYREKTGKGQHIDIALLDCMFTFLENYPPAYLLFGDVPPRSGNGRPWTAPCGTYKTKDGKYVHFSGTQNALFRKVCRAMGREDLIDEPDYATPRLRKTHEPRLDPIIIDWVAQYTRAEVVKLLEGAGVPYGEVNSVDEITDDPHIKAREMVRTMKDDVLGELPIVANPIKMTNASMVYDITPSMPGAYNNEILTSKLGFDQAKIEQLKKDGII